MQRRAAAVYFALFVLIGAGAYTFMQVGMAEPSVELDGPSYVEGDEFTAGGVTYTVGSVTAETTDGEISRSANLTRFNESYRVAETVDNGSTVPRAGTEYAVGVESGDSPESFRLVEQFNVSAVLANDPDVENQTAEQGGVEYVFYTDGSREPLDEYLPDPDVQGPFGVGDQLEWQLENETTAATVDAVSAESVTVSWEAPQEEGQEVEEGGNVTLGGTQHFAHFQSNSSVQVLPTNEYYAQYQQDLGEQEYYQERQSGFWGIVLLSFLGAILLFAAAYLPTKG